MLSRLIFLRRNLTAIQLLPEIKSSIRRPVASLTRQSKRPWRNLLVVTLIGTGTFYGYRAYLDNQWYNDMADSDQTLGTKHRIVVLGTGETILKHYPDSSFRFSPTYFRLRCYSIFETCRYTKIWNRLHFAAKLFSYDTTSTIGECWYTWNSNSDWTSSITDWTTH